MPLILITVSIRQEAYSSHNAGYCWLSNEDGVIWAFLGPVFLVLILNSIILTASAIRIGTARKNLTRNQQVKTALISAFILTPVLGMPWIVSFAKIVTVGIQNELVLRILDSFIDYVFICLNAPTGIVFFVIVFKRFREHRRGIRAEKEKKTDQSTAASDFAKFRRTKNTEVDSCSTAKYNVRRSPTMLSDASNSESEKYKLKSIIKPPRESLFPDGQPNSIYSTLDKTMIDEKEGTGKNQLGTSNPVYETSTNGSGDKNCIEMAVLRKDRENDDAKLVYSDNEENDSFVTKGIRFIRNSLRLSGIASQDTEAAEDSIQAESPSKRKAGFYQNKYLQHLHKLHEKTLGDSEDLVGGESDDNSEQPNTRKTSFSPKRKVDPKIKELKGHFDYSDQELIDESTKSSEDPNSNMGSPVLQALSKPLDDLSQLQSNEAGVDQVEKVTGTEECRKSPPEVPPRPRTESIQNAFDSFSPKDKERSIFSYDGPNRAYSPIQKRKSMSMKNIGSESPLLTRSSSHSGAVFRKIHASSISDQAKSLEILLKKEESDTSMVIPRNKANSIDGVSDGSSSSPLKTMAHASSFTSLENLKKSSNSDDTVDDNADDKTPLASDL